MNLFKFPRVKPLLGNTLKESSRVDRYCFLTKEENYQADLLIAEFKQVYHAACKNNRKEVMKILIELEMFNQGILVNCGVPKLLLTETWHAYIGYAFIHKPFLVKYLMIIGEVLKPLVDQSRKVISTPTGGK